MRGQPGKMGIGSLVVTGSLLLFQLVPAYQISAAPKPALSNSQVAVRTGKLSDPNTEINPPPLPTELQLQANGKANFVYGKLPRSFEANEGQTAEEVKFLSRGPGYTLFLTAMESVIVLRGLQQSAVSGSEKSKLQLSPGRIPVSAEFRQKQGSPEPASLSVLRMKLAGASPDAPAGLNELPGTTNYFIGNQADKWRTGIRSYASVKYSNVYPGVDLVYYGNGNQLEFDFIVAAGANPAVIQMTFEGADKIEVDRAGNLLMKVAGQSLKLHKPSIYQSVEGVRKELAGGYRFDVESRSIGFDLASLDSSLPVVIDPVLEYSTLLGGSGGDVGVGIAVDQRGSAYITGQTTSIDFPTTPGAIQPVAGYDDAFVLKLSPDGSALEYATYLGGSDLDWAVDIALDASGNAYVTGETFSNDFPTTPGSFQRSCPSTASFCWPGFVFVTKLNSRGTVLSYSSYLGGAFQAPGAGGFSRPGGIAVDAAGHAYVTGQVAAADFPTTPGAFQTRSSGSGDAFVTKFAIDGASLVYSTYLGGSNEDHGFGIAVDVEGNAFVTGYTGRIEGPNDFPTTPGSFQPTGNTEDAFVTKLNPSGTGLVYSTLLGGDQVLSGALAYFDSGLGIAIDAAGSAYVTGKTWSSNFPILNPPAELNKPLVSGSYSFITKLKPDGSGLVYSTYLALGGGGGIAVDSTGNAYVTGSAQVQRFPYDPQWFPYVNRLPSNFGENGDVFVMKLDASGSVLRYAITLGDWFVDYGNAIALDLAGNAYITGLAVSPKFPITHSLMPPYLNSGGAFVAKIAETTRKADLSVTALSGKLRQTETGEIQTVYSITVRNDGPHDAERVTLDERVFIHYPISLLEYWTTQGVCKNLTGRIMCDLGRMANGQSVNLQWVVTDTTDVLYITVKSATAEDPVPSNNSASLDSMDLSGQYVWVSNNSGTGKVVSNPPGINCTDNYQNCIHYYEQGTVVTLTPLPALGYKLQQWTGACSAAGTGPCTIQITGGLRDGYIYTGAHFDLLTPTPIIFDTDTSADAEVGVPFHDDSFFQGGVPPYNVQVVRGSLPPGLQIDSGYGLTGLPSKPGKFTFTLQVIDRFGTTASKTFRLQVYPALMISTSTVKSGAVGKKYNIAFKFHGGKKPNNWSIVTGSLPAGLSFNAANGSISGKPQQAGLFDLVIQVVDRLGGIAQKNFTITID